MSTVPKIGFFSDWGPQLCHVVNPSRLDGHTFTHAISQVNNLSFQKKRHPLLDASVVHIFFNFWTLIYHWACSSPAMNEWKGCCQPCLAGESGAACEMRECHLITLLLLWHLLTLKKLKAFVASWMENAVQAGVQREDKIFLHSKMSLFLKMGPIQAHSPLCHY